MERRRAEKRAVLALAIAMACAQIAPGQEAAKADPKAEAPPPTAPAAPARQVPEQLAFANGLYASGRYAQAAEEYEEFIKGAEAGPDAADALFGLANARMFNGELKPALKHFRDFLVMAPNHRNRPAARFRAGELSYLVGEMDAAKAELTSLLGDLPDHTAADAAWRYLGEVGLKTGDAAGALAAFEASLKRSGNGRVSSQSKFGRARALADLGRPDEALAQLDELAKGGGEWAAKARFQAGKIHAAAGAWDRAAAAFEQVERDAPEGTLAPSARLERAVALAKLGRGDEAEALLQPLADDPRNPLAPRASLERGELLAAKGDMAGAYQVWSEAAGQFSRSPTAPALIFRAADAARRLGKAEEARQGYLKVAESAPDDPWADDALLSAAELALDARDLVAARRLATTLPTKYPASKLKPEAHLLEARAALASGQPAEAVAILEAVLKPADVAEAPRIETAQAARYYLALARRDGKEDAAAREAFLAIAAEGGSPYAATARYHLGEDHFRKGEYAPAAQEFAAYIQSAPKGASAAGALAFLAAAQAELGQWDRAEQALATLAELAPESEGLDRARVRVAEIAYGAKEDARAIALFGPVAAAAKSPQRPRALLGLGWALLRAGKGDEAAESFAALLKDYPQDPLAAEASLARAGALEGQGATDAALEAYVEAARAAGGMGEGAEAAEQARAKLLAKSGRHAEAAESFAAFLQAHPESTRIPDVLADLAWAFLDSGKPAEADVAFRKLLESHPASPRAPEARVSLAESAFQARDYDRVKDVLAPLVADPPPADADPSAIQSALFRWGRAELEKADPNAARTFDRLIALAPEGPLAPQARFWKAEHLIRAGDADGALAELGSLLGLPAPDPGDAAGRQLRALAGLRKAQALVLKEQWEQALAEADALAQDGAKDLPGPAELDFARGRALQGLVKFDDALAAYQRVIDSGGDGDLAARAQLMRGETYFHKREYKAALREFLKVDILYDAPRWQPLALLEAGKVHERLQEPDRAVATYDALIKRYPDHPAAAEAARLRDQVTKAARTPEKTETES